MFKASSARADVGLSLVRLGIVLILLGLAYSFLWPRTFEAIARIKIEKDHTEIHSRGHGFDPYWVQTEFEMIQAKVVLYPVITNLNLTSKWARSAGWTNDLSVEQAYMILKGKLLIRQSRNTAITEICAFSNDPGEAAELANVIATTFRGKKLEDRRKMHAAFINHLEELWQKETQRIGHLESLVSDLSQVPERTREHEKQKEELETLRTFCENVAKKIEREKQSAVNPPVQIIDLATVPTKAIRPIRAIVLLLVSGGAALVVLGLALLTWPIGD